MPRSGRGHGWCHRRTDAGAIDACRGLGNASADRTELTVGEGYGDGEGVATEPSDAGRGDVVAPATHPPSNASEARPTPSLAVLV